jgi:Fe-S-cluster-containing dehydrogenase component/DMSO reductase anchor subunit
MNSPSPGPSDTLIDELLAEQQQLTAVDRFVRQHPHDAVPAQAKYYRDLIPLTLPQPGQQYAFEVDLDRCTGCKACVSACHSLNGLDDGETWREVGLLFSDDWRHPFQQTVTTACHHCVDPACLNGCPVLAYDKDPVTGIVRHLDDQCIGCQYCVMKCPYEVPKFSAQRGIVRKCDMCASRLAVGEAPACAQACPSEAIRITIVDQSQVAAAARRGQFLPGAPDPSLTLPTTRYRSSRLIPRNLLGGDHARTVAANPHSPLVFMLVLTQLSVGTSVAALFAEPAKWLLLAALGAGVGALGIATLHLGRPLQAWRAFLGWRKSWFSREVIAFSTYLLLAAAATLAVWFSGAAGPLPAQPSTLLPLKIFVALAGLVGVACSAMIYADTGREFWRASQCFGKFFGSTLLLGAATELVFHASRPTAPAATLSALIALMFAATLAKLGFERRIFHHWVDENTPTLTTLNKTARLLTGQLGLLARIRVAVGVFGGCVLPMVLMIGRPSGGAPAEALALAALAFCVAGELLERGLFFRAEVSVKMPGAVAQ